MRGVTHSSYHAQKLHSQFLLTRLMRGVTVRIDGARHVITISTHTPHARRDDQLDHGLGVGQNFYSHASCEA